MNKGTLVQTSFWLIVLTVAVKLLGFARDQIVAFLFGASPISDAYYLTLTFVIGLLSVIGGTGATAVVPVLTDLWQRHRSAAWDTVRAIGLTYLGIVVGVAVMVAFGGPWLIQHVLGPGLPVQTRPFALQLVRAFSLGFLFWAFVPVLQGVLNSRKSFLVPACGPIVLNATILAVLLLGGRRFGIGALAAGTVLGMVAQFLLLAPFVLVARAHDRRQADDEQAVSIVPEARARVWALARPVLVIGLLAQLPAIVDKAFASSLPVGSVSVLSFAQKLMQLPLGLFVGGVITVFYTSLSDRWANHDPEGAADQLGLGGGVTLLLGIPAAVGLAVLHQPIVEFVFQHGRFDAAAAHLTAAVLVYYCIGLPFVGLNLMLVRNAYATGTALTPMWGYLVALFVNAVGDWTLSRVMGPAGIALASSLGAITLAGFLVSSWTPGFRRAVSRAIRTSLQHALASSAVMGAVVLLLSLALAHRPLWLRLIVPGGLGLAVYVALIVLTGPREVRLLVARVRG